MTVSRKHAIAKRLIELKNPDNATTTARITTLGKVAVYWAENEARLPVRPQLLLVYLALHEGERISRDSLAALLWSSTDIRKARHSLSQALYVIRTALPDMSISVDDNSIQLDSIVELDVRSLQADCAGDNIEIARALITRSFLPIYHPTVPKAFIDWRDAYSVYLNKRAMEVLRRAVYSSYASCDWMMCLRIGEELVAQEPLTAEIAGLIENAKKITSEVSTIGQTCAAQPNFIGRAQDIQKLRIIWNAVRVGKKQLCVVRGESGIGKSRLAEQLARIAAIEGAFVLNAACYSAERRIAFAWVLAIIDQLAAGRHLSGLSMHHANCLEALTSGNGQALDNFGPASKHILFDAITSAITQASARRPIVIWVDDFQWADESSIEWIHHFYRTRKDDAPVLLMICVRADTTVDNPPWLEKPNADDVLDLGLLDRAAAEQLAAAVLGHENVNAARTIVDRCMGNPFYIIAMAREWGSDGHQDSFSSANLLPEAISHSILNQFKCLSSYAQSIAELLAISQKGLEFDVLLKATELTLPTLVEAIGELEKARLIRGDPIELSHDLVKEAISSTIAPITRQLRHRQLLLAFGLGVRASIRASHAHFAGARAEACKTASIAATEAANVYAYGEALYFRHLAAENATTVDERWRALSDLHSLLTILRKYSKANEFIDELYHLCQLKDDHIGILHCNVSRIAIRVSTQSEDVDALWTAIKDLLPDTLQHKDTQLLHNTLTVLVHLYQHAAVQEEMDAVLSQMHLLDGGIASDLRVVFLSQIAMLLAIKRPLLAVPIVNEAIATAKLLQDPWAMVRCLCARGIVNINIGEMESALSDYNAAEALIGDDGASELFCSAYINRACILFGQGAFDAARVQNSKAMQVGTSDILIPMMNETCGYLSSGDYNEAIGWANRTLIENGTFRAPWVEIVARSVRGLAELALGDLKSALNTYDDVQRLNQRGVTYTSDPSYNLIFQARIECVKNGNVSACKVLVNALESTPYIQPFGVCRIELALAELLLPIDADRSYAYARSCAEHSEKLGSHFMVARAKEHMQKIRDSGR